MSTQQRPPQLILIDVKNLLGHFNHRVDFPAKDPFVILHGPNGVGKTHLLRLTNAILSRRYWEIGRIRFDEARFGFSDGTEIQIGKTVDNRVGQQSEFDNLENDAETGKPGSDSDYIRIALTGTNHDPIVTILPAKLGRTNRRLAMLLDGEADLQQVGHNQWLDRNTDVVLSTDEALNRIDASPRVIREYLRDSEDTEIAKVDAFLMTVTAKLVETQRLLAVDDIPSRGQPRNLRGRRPTVLDYSTDLARQISNKLAENSRISSQLDRTFPSRLLNSKTGTLPSDSELIRRYEVQSVFRNRLAEVSMVEDTQDISINNDRDLDMTERRVLAIYLEDAEKKLATFRDLLEKVTLLQEIINERFLYKSMRVDSNEGFVFVTDSGENIKPVDLSSGEQHELVLLYALLFRTDPGSVVMIDEPEISLHVKWQRSFLSDLEQVAVLSKLRFIIATHSPQIVDRWRSKMVLLAPDAEHDVNL